MSNFCFRVMEPPNKYFYTGLVKANKIMQYNKSWCTPYLLTIKRDRNGFPEKGLAVILIDCKDGTIHLMKEYEGYIFARQKRFLRKDKYVQVRDGCRLSDLF